MQRSDFSRTIDEVLNSSDDRLLGFRIVPQTDTTGLRDLLRAMANKIQLQELELEQQAESILSLKEELRMMRRGEAEGSSVANELRKLNADVEALFNHQRMVGQRVERLQSSHADLQTEVARLRYQPVPNSQALDAHNGMTGQPTHSVKANATHTPAKSRNAWENEDLNSLATLTFVPNASPVPVGVPNDSNSTGHSVGNRAIAGLELNDTAKGAKVTAVKHQGPAYLAGIEVGDIVTRVGNREIHRKVDFVNILQECLPGQCVNIAIRKENGSGKTVKMYLASSQGVQALPK
jgi:predicted metalloprotease with PDZ domain